MSEEQAVEQTDARTSFEDKFLGVRTKIKTKSDEVEEVESDLDLEVIDDRPPEDRRPPKKEVSSQEDEDELEGYSDKVKKRINKLKYEQHEERRQREAAEKMQRVIEGRNTSDVSTEDFWREFNLDTDRIDDREIWKSGNVVAGDLIIGSLLKEIRDMDSNSLSLKYKKMPLIMQYV